MLRAGHVLQLTVVAMLGLATIAVHSAGMTIDSSGLGLGSMLHSRHTVYAVLAIGSMWVASRVDTRKVFRSRVLGGPVLWLVCVSLILVAMTLIPGMGRSVNGASRWLRLGPGLWGLSFQPSELVKWTLVLAVANWCAKRSGVMKHFGNGLGPCLVLVAVSCGLVMIEDLGTAVLIGLVAVCMLIAGGARWWHLALTIPPAAGAVAIAIAQSPFRLARLTAFLDPWADPMGTGYHPIQSMLAIAQGGVLGRGLGNGIQKFGYLPEDTTDFIFAIICEELGMAGVGLVVGLYLIIVWTALGIARDCRDTFSRLFVLGVLLTVGMQAVINIAVVTVMMPTKGIALPLLSAGGTGWILTAAALGLVAGLDDTDHVGVASGESDMPRDMGSVTSAT